VRHQFPGVRVTGVHMVEARLHTETMDSLVLTNCLGSYRCLLCTVYEAKLQVFVFLLFRKCLGVCLYCLESDIVFRCVFVLFRKLQVFVMYCLEVTGVCYVLSRK
jgi:hypothetical protein